MLNSGNLYKWLDACSNGFWNAKKCLTYNKPIICVTGTRSVGKSTGVACLCLLDFIINNHKFMYVRRRQRDTYKTCKTFFDNAIQIVTRETPFKILGFKFYRGKYYIVLEKTSDGELNWLECGMACPLSEEEDLKSSVFSDYFTIIYDEFISKDPNRYLGTRDNPEFEWDAVMSLYQTVDRGIDKPFRDETRIFLLGNKSTIYNPICLSIGIADYVQSGAHFVSPKNKLWVWEDVDRVETTSLIEESFAYKMSSEKVKKYAYHNEGSDTTHFIRKPDIAKYHTTVKLRGTLYGIYSDDDFNFYINKPKVGYHIISLDVESHDGTDLHLIQRWRESPTLTLVSNAYKKGKLYFGNGKIQASFLKYLDFIP